MRNPQKYSGVVSLNSFFVIKLLLCEISSKNKIFLFEIEKKL